MHIIWSVCHQGFILRRGGGRSGISQEWNVSWLFDTINCGIMAKVVTHTHTCMCINGTITSNNIAPKINIEQSLSVYILKCIVLCCVQHAHFRSVLTFLEGRVVVVEVVEGGWATSHRQLSRCATLVTDTPSHYCKCSCIRKGKGGGGPRRLWSRADTDDVFSVHSVQCPSIIIIIPMHLFE